MRFREGFIAGVAAGLLMVVGVATAAARGASRPASLFGHFSYDVADRRDLEPVDAKGEVLMRRSAAQAFKGMQTAARAEGLLLMPVSGFRDLSRQRRLFFAEAAERNQSVRERARTCAPPGYSEHHTGFSLDVGDGAHHESQLELRFKDTEAFQWLVKNAARFHFELSFPPGNRQHVAYEPWHWRFVGDPVSFRTFYYARLAVP